ncbi:hypothetical protein BC941DRAFT_454528 [Chlamydoabsidia padenii]|nr:hypothetical protein BC941DRAFT_454528 [Chlamydoabsidia padenii]
MVQDSNIEWVKSDWSDHSILSTTIQVGFTNFGPGLWRANPIYVHNPDFQAQLNNMLDDFIRNIPADTSPQTLWDDLKRKISIGEEFWHGICTWADQDFEIITTTPESILTK